MQSVALLVGFVSLIVRRQLLENMFNKRPGYSPT